MGVVQFNSYFPVSLIDYVGAAIFVVIVLGVILRLRPWTKVLPSSLIADAKRDLRFTRLLSLFFSELAQRVIAQRDVIVDSRSRRVTHMIVFWGFVGLAFATVWDDVFFHNGSLPPPLSPANFGNIVGNVGGLLVLVGATLIIARYAVREKYRRSWKGDLVFLATLYLATITGFATEFARLSFDWFAYGNYIVHLTFVTALLVTAPFTHFFHAILTPVTRYFGRVESVLTSSKDGKQSYRKQAMIDLAEDVRAGAAKPTYPEWLRERKEE